MLPLLTFPDVLATPVWAGAGWLNEVQRAASQKRKTGGLVNKLAEQAARHRWTARSVPLRPKCLDSSAGALVCRSRVNRLVDRNSRKAGYVAVGRQYHR